MANRNLYVDTGRKKRRFNTKLLLILPFVLLALFFLRSGSIAKNHAEAGDDYLSNRKLPEALFEYKKAYYVARFDRGYSLKIAEVYAQALLCKDAERYYRRSKDIAGLGRAADCYRLTGNIEKTEKILNESQAEELTPYRGKLLLLQGKTDEAISILESYYEKYKTAENLELLVVGLGVKNYDAGVERYKSEKITTPIGEQMIQRSALSQDSKNLFLADILMNNSLADLGLNIATSVTKNNPGYRDAYLTQAKAYFLTGKTEDAITSAQKAVELDPYYPAAYRLLAQLFDATEDKEEAEKARTKANDLDLNS